MSGADDRGAGETAGAADDWMPEIEEISRRRELARAMGGADKVKRQLASGRLTVRERIGSPTRAASPRSEP